jgi:hypothetical protein
MVLTSIVAFLGGSTFRMLWGEISTHLNRRADDKRERELILLQDDIAAKQHARNMEAQRLQHELGVDLINVKSRGDIELAATVGFLESAKGATTLSGIYWVDAWNCSVRPFCATVSALLWVGSLYARGWQVNEWDQALIGVTLGYYFASRDLGKR